MSKDSIQRSDVHDTHMKYVILRLDYSGMQDVDALKKEFHKRYGGNFSKEEVGVLKSASLTFREEDLKAISKAVTASIRDIENGQIFRYRGLKHVKGDVTLDISQFYLCMTIGYHDDYEGLNKYLDSFKGAITTFKEKFSYFTPKRLGIRKCRVENFRQIQEIDRVFESFVFNDGNLPIGKFGESLRVYRASLSDDGEYGIKVNVTRSLQPVLSNGRNEIMTSLDIDAYVDNQNLLISRNINKIIDEVNNFEFKVYKMCMKEDALLGR